MNKTVKVISILLMVLAMVLGTSNFCLATENALNALNPSELVGQVHASTIGEEGQGNVLSIGNQIIGIITTVGVIVAVIILTVLGIKYMMGSASEKAEYKKTMIPYLVGAFLIFGASAIIKVIVSITSIKV